VDSARRIYSRPALADQGPHDPGFRFPRFSAEADAENLPGAPAAVQLNRKRKLNRDRRTTSAITSDRGLAPVASEPRPVAELFGVPSAQFPVPARKTPSGTARSLYYSGTC